MWSGTFSAPANTGPSSALYTVVYSTQNVLGLLATVDGGSVTVATAPALQSSRSALAFGSVRVGRGATRTLIVRNTGASAAAGTLTCSGAPFAIVGERSGTLSFRLRSGARRAIDLRFRPATIGTANGTVTLTQPGAADTVVTLAGTGRARR